MPIRTSEAQSPPERTMRCSPGKRRPALTGFGGGWLLPAAISVMLNCSGSVLGRAGGEGDEEVLEPGNFGCFVSGSH